MNVETLDKAIKSAVRSIFNSRDYLPDSMQEDVEQEVWYEALTSPKTRAAWENSVPSERRKLIMSSATRIIASLRNEDRISANENDQIISVEIVKDVLKGKPVAPHFARLVETGMLELSLSESKYSREYHEALRRRYIDKVIPEQGAEAVADSRAHTALTDEVNTILRHMHEPPEEYYKLSDTAYPTLQDGPKVGNHVEPGSRKATGGHSDPTGEAAVGLVMNPAGRELFYQETPLAEVLAGKGYA